MLWTGGETCDVTVARTTLQGAAKAEENGAVSALRRFTAPIDANVKSCRRLFYPKKVAEKGGFGSPTPPHSNRRGLGC
jgi:hypothetical protein